MKKIIIAFTVMMFLFVTVACGPTIENKHNENTTSVEQPENDEYLWEQDYTWKFTHEGAKGLAEDCFATAFAKLVNERSNGHIKIDIYDFNQLGSGADQFELIQGGAIEFGLASSGAIASLVPEAGIFGLHYIYPDTMAEMFDFLATSKTCKILNNVMAEKNFHVFVWNIEGPHVWSTKKPINSLADMKGLKFRTQANQLEMASFRAYGASPTTVAFAELYSALQLGTVDGQQQTGLGNNLMNYYDVAPYYIDAHASYYVDAPVCNKRFYESLDPYIQNLIMECIMEARGTLATFLEEQEGGEARRIAEEHGVTWIEFDEAQKAEFAKASVSAHETFLKIGGDKAEEILNTLLTELGRN